MNSQNLRYVLEIAASGSISQAAQNLYLSQPYLSRVLMETEKEYDITIFTRGRRGLSVTPEGEQFLLMARSITGQLAEFDRQLHMLRRSDTLRICSCSSGFIAEAYLRYLEQHPAEHLRASYFEMDNYAVIRQIHRGAADIGFAILGDANRDECEVMMHNLNVQFEVLKEMKLHLITRVGHPLSRLPRPILPEDIQDYPFVLYPRVNTDGAISASESEYLPISNYEYLIDPVDWSKVQAITYVNSRAMYYDLITRTDTVSFGFQPMEHQERFRGILSLPLDDVFEQIMHREGCSRLYLLYEKGRILPDTAREFTNVLKSLAF